MLHLPSSATNGWGYTETFSTQSGCLCPAPKSSQVSSTCADAPVEGQGHVLFPGAFCMCQAKAPLTWVTCEHPVLQTWPLAWINITHAFSKNREKERDWRPALKEINDPLWKCWFKWITSFLLSAPSLFSNFCNKRDNVPRQQFPSLHSSELWIIYLHEAESLAEENNSSCVSPGVSLTCTVLANYVCEIIYIYMCICMYACMLGKSQLSKILHASGDLKYHCNNPKVLEWAGTKTVVRPWFNFGKIKFPVALRGKLSTLDLAKPHESDFGFVKPYLKPEVFWI